MPTTFSTSTYNWAEALNKPIYDPVGIFRQVCSSSPMLATLLGKDAERKAQGLQNKHFKYGDGAWIVKRLMKDTTANGGNVALSASVSTSIDPTVVEKNEVAIAGDYALYYEYMPVDIDMWIRGGSGADNELQMVNRDAMVNRMTQRIADDIVAGTGATTLDGLGKWTSETANKWGIDCSVGGNAYYRGQVEAVAIADWSLDKLRQLINNAGKGEAGSGTNKYSAGNFPTLGLVDWGLWERLQKLVSDKQAIYLPDGGEYAKLGGFFQAGIKIDMVTFLPDIALQRLKDTNVSEGEMFLINPEDFQIYMHKDFAFNMVTDPSKLIDAKGAPKLDWIIDPTVLWGKHQKLLTLINMFCSKPRNQNYTQFT